MYMYVYAFQSGKWPDQTEQTFLKQLRILKQTHISIYMGPSLCCHCVEKYSGSIRAAQMLLPLAADDRTTSEACYLRGLALHLTARGVFHTRGIKQLGKLSS